MAQAHWLHLSRKGRETPFHQMNEPEGHSHVHLIIASTKATTRTHNSHYNTHTLLTSIHFTVSSFISSLCPYCKLPSLIYQVTHAQITSFLLKRQHHLFSSITSLHVLTCIPVPYAYKWLSEHKTFAQNSTAAITKPMFADT